MRFAPLLAILAFFAVASRGLAADTASPGDPVQILVDLLAHLSGLAEIPFTKGDKAVRTAYVKYFEAKCGAEIKTGLGDSYKTIMKWLDDNKEIKETLLSAIDPDSDNISKALSIFRDLWTQGAEQVKLHPNLAIAVAVTWDNPRGVYDYRHPGTHQEPLAREHDDRGAQGELPILPLASRKAEGAAREPAVGVPRSRGEPPHTG